MASSMQVVSDKMYNNLNKPKDENSHPNIVLNTQKDKTSVIPSHPEIDLVQQPLLDMAAFLPPASSQLAAPQPSKNPIPMTPSVSHSSRSRNVESSRVGRVSRVRRTKKKDPTYVAATPSAPARDIAVVTPKFAGQPFKLLVCPGCSVYMQPPDNPIFQCNEGHLLCAKCVPTRRSCPAAECKSASNRSCKTVYSRNLALEEMCNLVTIECAYTGCTKVLPYLEKEQHARECYRRPWKCHEANCVFQGDHNKLSHHLVKCHSFRPSNPVLADMLNQDAKGKNCLKFDLSLLKSSRVSPVGQLDKWQWMLEAVGLVITFKETSDGYIAFLQHIGNQIPELKSIVATPKTGPEPAEGENETGGEFKSNTNALVTELSNAILTSSLSISPTALKQLNSANLDQQGDKKSSADSNEEPKSYSYSLRVQGSERSVTWQGPCVSFRSSPANVLAQNECLHLTQDTFKLLSQLSLSSPVETKPESELEPGAAPLSPAEMNPVSLFSLSLLKLLSCFHFFDLKNRMSFSNWIVCIFFMFKCLYLVCDFRYVYKCACGKPKTI